MQTNKLSLASRFLVVICMSIGIFASAQAGEYECRDVAPDQPGHSVVFLKIEELHGLAAAQVQYCDGEYPRWIARWDVYETFEGWRKYASARCFDGNGPLNCHLLFHAVANDSYETIDLEVDVPLSTLKELYESSKLLHPDFEIFELKHIVIKDGGAWSEADYGFKVYYLEPPEYRRGDTDTLVRRCEPECGWVHPWPHYTGSAGTHTWLRDRRRKLEDPLINQMPEM